MTTPPDHRQLLRSDLFEQWEQLTTDQRSNLPAPARQKPAPPGAPLINLPTPETFTFDQLSLLQALRSRKSRRQYLPQALSLEELAFLCWATQGVRSFDPQSGRLFRTTPSAGARQSFETYLAVLRVDGLEMGLYRYLSLEHQLGLVQPDPELTDKIARACAWFAQASAVTFAWTAIPYRTEWRYGAASAKLILQDVGHVCQNLYLACEAIGCGTCAVSAYGQHAMDELLGVDGESEMTVYCAPVGKAAGE